MFSCTVTGSTHNPARQTMAVRTIPPASTLAVRTFFLVTAPFASCETSVVSAGRHRLLIGLRHGPSGQGQTAIPLLPSSNQGVRQDATCNPLDDVLCVHARL